MELEELLPMNLQFFAEQPDAGSDASADENPKHDADADASSEDVPGNNDNSEDKDDDKNENIDGDKTVEKLKKRLGSKTAEAYDLKHQLDEQNQLLEDLKTGKKSIKELANDDKKSKEEIEKDKEITRLKSEIARSKALADTDAVFKSEGLVVNDDVLSMVVGNGTDNEAIYNNAKALTDLINSVKEDARKEFMKGSTPRLNKKPGNAMTKQQILAIPDDFKRKQAIANNIDLFK
ncbi:capsid assembly scaffolding protein Gp46 family protein [Pediococcus acidilactici]|uniref:capsid assembly scaffolding protein Gp46 family protein n=1 Tax=Pediococcus acidilactici TaxID=1254 RepID=UPI003CEBA680